MGFPKFNLAVSFNCLVIVIDIMGITLVSRKNQYMQALLGDGTDVETVVLSVMVGLEITEFSG